MTLNQFPRLPKWPFLAGDAVLIALAWWIASASPNPFTAWPLLFTVGCVAGGAWLAAAPFVMEYRAGLKFAEADRLTDAVSQLNRLETTAEQIGLATGQWQTAQEHSAQTVSAAREIAERMTTEARAFADFMQKANDTEKSHLRLEVEKLRRAESEWLQVLVRLLDNVHALYQAGSRSGQANVREQLGRFQGVCRDVVRRVGLLPIEARVGELFEEEKHQLADSVTRPAGEAQISEAIATGYTYQGQLLRKPLVQIKPASGDASPEEQEFQLEGESAGGPESMSPKAPAQPSESNPQRSQAAP